MNKDLKYLTELTWAYRASRTLQVAVKLGVFTELAEQPKTALQLAASSGAKPELLDKILIACTAMELLQKQGGQYQNTPLSAEYLVEGKPLYQGDIIRHGAGVWEFWDQLPQAVLEHPSGPENEQQAHRHFILGMHNITMGGRGQLFLDAVDLSGRRQLFDVGGGPGTYSILACKKYPDLKATLFDLPETVEIAEEMIQKEGLSNRISVRRGSWEKDECEGGGQADDYRPPPVRRANQDGGGEVEDLEKDQCLERAEEVDQQKTEEQASDNVSSYVEHVDIAYLCCIFLFAAEAREKGQEKAGNQAVGKQ